MSQRCIKLCQGDALIAVDVQNDFLPGGVMGVPRGGEVIGPLSRIGREFGSLGLPVFATRDWHPPDHCSFRPRGGPWPPHCIQGTHGAELATDLHLPANAIVISKATRPETDAYSGFQGTGLAQRLRDIRCRRIFVGGLATDYCVRATVLDGRAAGFEAVVLTDAVRALEVRPGDGERALEEMKAGGAEFTSVERLLA